MKIEEGVKRLRKSREKFEKVEVFALESKEKCRIKESSATTNQIKSRKVRRGQTRDPVRAEKSSVRSETFSCQSQSHSENSSGFCSR